jgi:hypothetical protein
MNFSYGALVASMMATSYGFQAKTSTSRRTAALNMVAVDPTTVTKEDYQDICGVSFDDGSLADRLQRTNFLYPGHVAVIEDIAPVASAMVDEIVS